MISKYDYKIDQVREQIAALLKNIVDASQLSLKAYEEKDTESLKTVQEMLGNVAVQGDVIDNEIIKTFALFGPEAKELRSLVAYLKMTNELVRIGDGIKKYARRMKEHLNSECDLTPLNSTIIQLHKSTVNALAYILECFTNLDTCNIEEYYAKIMVEESKNDDLFSILEKEIMGLIIIERELSIEYVKVLGTLRKLERSCDRSVNIANLMMYAKKGGQLSHYS
ncbi:MAG: PhoU family transcriptional regulator [Sulfurimonas sp.]|nr:PhoU family transcriptional regulator [Sulfurimonas sp.]MBU3940227.1 PhoU family transcriptional regulator [bacterium]MBU4024097.1 PhoU family transcriptional regulator [bacterium]MBU4058075.1 PhoU family transcriptional regulator [bacterium]